MKKHLLKLIWLPILLSTQSLAFTHADLHLINSTQALVSTTYLQIDLHDRLLLDQFELTSHVSKSRGSDIRYSKNMATSDWAH